MLRLLLTLLGLLAVLPVRADEWWAWSTVDFYRRPPWKACLFMGNFADEVDGSYVQIVSPRLRYAAAEWLELGLGLSTLSIENTTTHDRYGQLRPELEINPQYNLTKLLRVEWRNRMEWRENEGQALTTSRTRHRMQLAWTLPQPLGPLTRIFASNEWLQDLHLRRHMENRFVPLGLTFKLSDSVDLDLFYMIDSKRGKSAWKHESVVVTYLRVRF